MLWEYLNVTPDSFSDGGKFNGMDAGYASGMQDRWSRRALTSLMSAASLQDRATQLSQFPGRD